MAISKQSHNTGATGGHGMQEIDTFKRRMLEEKFDVESSEVTCSCGNGCEFTILGERISFREAILLGRYIRKNNLCPFCRTKDGRMNFEYAVNNQDAMQIVTFEKDDRIFNTIYKPQGYRFLPPEINEEE